MPPREISPATVPTLMPNQFPSFYIIGAPKCGTTSLYWYLKQNENVFLPNIKEPQYFCDDFPNIMQVSTEKTYLDLFRRAQPSQLVGEASVWYLFSERAVPNILKVRPDAKFIVMLRDPVEAAVSYHNHAVYSLREGEVDFEIAWKNRNQSKQTIANSVRDEDYPLRAYEDVFNYSDQLDRLYKIAPKENVKVIFLEKFLSDKKTEFESVLEFLGLAKSDQDTFPILNAARRWRFKNLERLLLNPPAVLKTAMGIVERVSNSLGIRPITLLHKLLSTEGSASYVSPEFRMQLEKSFRLDVIRLKKRFPNEIEEYWESGETNLVSDFMQSNEKTKAF